MAKKRVKAGAEQDQAGVSAVGDAQYEADGDEAPDLSYIHESLRHLAIPIGDLKPDPRNARLHSERNIEAIGASLRRFGQDQPVVARAADHQLIKGHGRMAAASLLGWTHMAVLLVEDSDIEATLRSLADNRSAELAEWDYRTLSGVFKDLQSGGTEVTGLGWQPFELAPMLTANWDGEPSGPGSGQGNGATSPYSPNLEPTTSQEAVTAEDIEARRREMSEAIGQKEGMVSVTCPSCAHEFHIRKNQLD